LKYSTSKENYLKSIFHLQQERGLVSTNEVASALQTRPASVTDMLKKLKQQKLILYERYRGFKLTSEGKKVAIQIIRKHRLWEYFLVEKLQFGWDEVHEVAEELEHISSKKLIDQLDTYLGRPQIDPHGDPIPNEQGKMAILPQQCLSDTPVNKPVRVSGVSSQTPEMLDLLHHKHIRIGTLVEVKRKFTFDDSIELKIRKQPAITVSDQVARNILVNDAR
jgi:DtxR family transcriptional regulator, Mn-dependent transcriptional regulator